MGAISGIAYWLLVVARANYIFRRNGLLGNLLTGIEWTKLGTSISEVVMTVVGDHYGLYGRILPLSTHLVTDLGSDFVDLAEVVMTMEELFGLRFEPAEAAKVRTLADVVTLVERGLHLQQNSIQSPDQADVSPDLS